MRRREFVTLIGGATAAWPFAARAQQGMRRVGVLMIWPPMTQKSPLRVAALLKGLQEFGWIDGRNLHRH